MKSINLFLISFLVFSISHAQNWNKYYSADSTAFFPIIGAVEPTHDNNIFLVGTQLFGNTTIFKVDRFSGDTIWTKSDSLVSGLKQIPGTQDYYIIRSDGLFSSENWISRIDGQLNTIWKRDYQLNAEVIFDLEVLSDSSAFCFGYYSPMGGEGVFFKRLDKNGNIIFIDSTVQNLPLDDLVLKSEKLPNDDIVLFAQNDSQFKFFKYSDMGVFLDSAVFPIPGKPELEFTSGVNPYDNSINVMGVYEIDTTNLDTLDFAGYYISLDTNFAIRYQSSDTSNFNYLAMDFFSPDNSARITAGTDTTDIFNLSFFDMTNKYLNFSLGNSPNNFPNFPTVVKYVGQTQIIVAGSDFNNNYWAASFPTFINNLEKEISNEVIVFPNPTKEFINFSLDNIFNSGHAELYISDINGNIICTNRTTSNNFRFNTSKLKPGMYFYKIDSDKARYRGKFIKE